MTKEQEEKVVQAINRIQHAAMLQLGIELPLNVIARAAQNALMERYGKLVKENLANIEEARAINDFFEKNKGKKK